MSVTRYDLRSSPQSGQRFKTTNDAMSAAGNSASHKFAAGTVSATVYGTATTLTGTVYRSGNGPDPVTGLINDGVPADTTPPSFNGSLVTGIAPNLYTEAGVGFWYFVATAVTGGTATISFSGAEVP